LVGHSLCMCAMSLATNPVSSCQLDSCTNEHPATLMLLVLVYCRSSKQLQALSLGAYLVNSAWLDACKAAGRRGGMVSA
jgi:hypothetical protein